VALIAEQIAPLQQFSLYLARHPRPYNTIAIGLAVAGWVLLGIAFVLLFLKKSRPVSAEEARSFVKPAGLVQSFSGKAVGREAKTEWTFREIHVPERRVVYKNSSRKASHIARTMASRSAALAA
jgi:hypothetical protein